MIEVNPATSERWPDLVDLFERHWDGHGAGNRAALEDEIHGGAEPGLLAYLDGVPVGWCRVGPRESFARLEHSRMLARVDDEQTWSVVCFYVHPAAKRRGVAAALLEAATARAAAHGAGFLEGYPVRTGHPNIDAYTGYLPMFLAAGFEHVHDAGRRVLVRRRLVRAVRPSAGGCP